MDDFDYTSTKSGRGQAGALIWNILTVVVLLGVLTVALVFVVIFLNPSVSVNPFPPPTLPVVMGFPTATVTPVRFLEPTWTLSPTIEPTATNTPQPTPTSAPTETPFILFTASPAPEETQPTGGMPFVISPGTPVSTSSGAFHPEEGCNWLGIAGQVFDLSGAPVSGQQVRVGGTLAGGEMDILSLTGLANAYGTAGFYEFKLGDTPIASRGTLWVQLLDQAGLEMSDKIYFDTFDTCEKNLVFINFRQVR